MQLISTKEAFFWVLTDKSDKKINSLRNML
jgi:hypothetical protein